MKTILIFQTASFEVMKNILDTIVISGNCVFCATYNKCDTAYKKVYPDLKFLNLDNMISRSGGRQSKMEMRGTCFDEVYVPSSTPYFFGYNEVFSLVSELEYKYLILHDCHGRKKIYKRKNIVFQGIEYIITWSVSKVYEIIYKFKCMTYGK